MNRYWRRDAPVTINRSDGPPTFVFALHRPTIPWHRDEIMGTGWFLWIDCYAIRVRPRRRKAAPDPHDEGMPVAWHSRKRRADG